MAATRKEPRDIAELGPIGIAGEGLKLYGAHVKVYISIQLLMLPVAIGVPVADYILFAQYSSLPLHNMNGRSASPEAPRFLGGVEPWNQIEMLLISMVASLVFRAALALPQSIALYTVGLHYTGQPISFVDAIRAVTPRLWMRLALTAVYVAVMSTSVSLVQTVGNLLLQEFHIEVQWQLVWTSVMAVLSLAVAYALGIILMIASGVAVLEEDYGWAAMKKSLKLVNGKVNVAFFFQVLLIVPGFIEVGLGAALLFQLKKDDFHVLDVALLSLTVVVLLAWTTFFWAIGSLCAGVQYVSFKAYHNESLSDSFHQKRTLVDGYGDESRVPMLKGNVV